MFCTIIARKPGTCKRCGRAIIVGQRIRYGDPHLTYHLAADCRLLAQLDNPAGTVQPDASLPAQTVNA